MKTDEEIKKEVRAYWDRLISLVSESFEQRFRRDAQKKGKLIVKIPSIASLDEVVMPDFMSSKPRFNWLAICELLNIDYIEANTFINNVFKERPIQYESFFLEGQMFNVVLRARKRALIVHKKHKQQLPNKISALKNIEKTLMYHRPHTNKKAFQKAIDNLNYLCQFSDELIDYLENEWPASFGLDKNLDKDPKRQPCWNPILLCCYKELRKQHRHVASCEIIARLLKIIYPSVWTGDIRKNRESIRTRIDNMMPCLASSPL